MEMTKWVIVCINTWLHNHSFHQVVQLSRNVQDSCIGKLRPWVTADLFKPEPPHEQNEDWHHSLLAERLAWHTESLKSGMAIQSTWKHTLHKVKRKCIGNERQTFNKTSLNTKWGIGSSYAKSHTCIKVATFFLTFQKNSSVESALSMTTPAMK